MTDQAARLATVCPVFISQDIQKTVRYYTEVLSFRSAIHYDKVENFATLYRDEIEFIIVQAKKGEVLSNTVRHGEGYDAYINTAEVSGVDGVYAELLSKGVKLLSAPHMTAYGSYEFVFEDVDGRLIGVGRVSDKQHYFKNSDIEVD